MDTYAPVFIVEIDGKELPEDITQRVETFSYEEQDEKMDELKIRVIDEHIRFVDHPQLQPGKEVRARWGYLGNLSEVRVVTIKEIDYNFREDGVLAIEVAALDKGHLLTGRAARTCWKDASTAEVVENVARKHGLIPKFEIPGDYHRENLSQGGKNDMEMLSDLAKEMGCSCWVENDELHFKPDKVPPPVMKFRWREDRDGYLISMRIKVNAEKGKGTGAATESAGVDPLTKKEIKETTGAREEDVTVQLGDKRKEGETPLKEKDDETGRIRPTPVATAEEARQESKGTVEKAGMHALEASAKTIGLPHLRAKGSVTIENLGKAFSGDWRLKKVKHSITRAGYFCDLALARSDVAEAGRNPPAAKGSEQKVPAAGEGKPGGRPPVEVPLK